MCPSRRSSQLDLSVKLFPLLSKNIEINSLEMKRPQIELIRNAQGVWNFSTAGERSCRACERAGSGAATAARETGACNRLLRSAADSRWASCKLPTARSQSPTIRSASRAQYTTTLIVTLKDYAPGKPFSLDLTAHLPGNGSQTFSITGDGGPINNADLASTPFKGTVKLDEVSLSGAQKFLNSVPWQGPMQLSRGRPI